MTDQSDRVGVLDVGSNSVRFVVFDAKSRSPAYFFNEKVLCGLGRGIHETGCLHPEGRQRALVAIKRFSALADTMGLSKIVNAATAAVRDASDGPEFCKDVYAKTGLQLNVIDGQTEARLSALGVLVGWPQATGLMCDIGGASMELAALSDGDVTTMASSQLGPMHIGAEGLLADELTQIVDTRLDALLANFTTPTDTLYLVGGSWRALAKLDVVLNNYPLNILHAYQPDLDLFDKTLLRAIDMPAQEASDLTNTSLTRMRLVPMAAFVLRALLAKVKPQKIVLSSYGLREGLFYQTLPAFEQAHDPLLSSARLREAQNARFPGFGDHLFDWVEPVFRTQSNERLRLIRAACLLHDVSWRAHPDYRAQLCFDNATLTELSGLDHSERMILALALMCRYKTSPSIGQDGIVDAMLSEEEIAFATQLGKAMRLGAFFAGPDAPSLGALSLSPGRILWKIPKASVPLMGELAGKRFESLAMSLGVMPEIQIAR